MNTFCVLPWIHLATHPDGHVTLCCVSNHEKLMSAAKNYNEDGTITILNLNNNSIYDIINSDYYRKVRKQFLNNKIPEACKRCFEEEKNNISSKRISSQLEFKHFNLEQAKKLTSPTGYIRPNLKFLELRVGNKCNYKCRTCNPHSSSYWKDDWKKAETKFDYLPEFNNKDDDFNWPFNENFWNELGNYYEDLEQIYINGGEPTLIREHWKYINKLINKGKTDIILHYNINASIINTYSIYYWKQFKKVDIVCSVDDIDKRNSYIRYGSNWKTINKNIDKLIKENINLNICQTISFFNYYYLDEFYEWLKTKGLENKMYHNIVHYPEYLSPFALPLKTRKIIHEKFKKSKYYNRLKYLIPIFSKEDNVEKNKRCMEFTEYIDKLRNENFYKTFPELNKIL